MSRVVLALLALSVFSFSPLLSTERIIIISVNTREEVSIDGIKIDNVDNLSQQIQQRLWRSYMGNGKMPDIIHIRFDTDVPINLRSAVFGAVRDGQERTLNVLSLEKFKKKFADASDKQKDKLKKRFPILFQQTFPT
jgi:hypothetical protein